MAHQILNPVIGGARPGGPSKVAPGPAWAAKGRTQGQKTSGKDHRSKKGYTGSLAGVGRGTVGGQPVVFRSGPKGPRAFGGSVQLPRRNPIPRGAVTFNPAPQPSLMTRIGRGIKRRAAALGFQF